MQHKHAALKKALLLEDRQQAVNQCAQLLLTCASCSFPQGVVSACASASHCPAQQHGGSCRCRGESRAGRGGGDDNQPTAGSDTMRCMKSC